MAIDAKVKAQAFADWKKRLTYNEIAERNGISASTVKNWALHEWKPGKTKNKTRKGNRNACGHGGKLGNDNTLKHGGYSQIYWDSLSDEEKELIDNMPKDEETLLLEQIRLYSIRERRILVAINKLKNEDDKPIMDSVTKAGTQGALNYKSEDEIFITTHYTNKQSAIARLEAELTSVQRGKNKAIETLARLNVEKQKLQLMQEKDDTETEDMSDIEGLIYG
mgnify:FL=1